MGGRSGWKSVPGFIRFAIWLVALFVGVPFVLGVLAFVLALIGLAGAGA